MSVGRTNSGSGGGLSTRNAVLHVIASKGCTITFKKSGIIAKVLDSSKGFVHSDDTSLADYYFSVGSNNYGEWTIEASLNNATSSKTITINSNKQYDIYLRTAELYYYGDENISLTGGFVAKNTDSRYTAGGSITKNATSIYIANVTNGSRAAVTANKIDVTNFSQLEATAYRTNGGDSSTIGLSNNLPDTNGVHVASVNKWYTYWSTSRTNPTVLSLDISALSGSYYVFCTGLINGGLNLCRLRLVE